MMSAHLGGSDERRRSLRNNLQELLLLAGVAATAGAVASLLLGPVGLGCVVVAGLLACLLRPRVPVALLLWMYGAQPLPQAAAPQLHWIVEVLTARAGLQAPPTLYYVASPIANAFVLGSGDRSALVVTDGLLRVLTGREVVGVLAHEVSHVHNGDIAVMNPSDLVARLAQWLGWLGLASFLVTLPLSLTERDARPLLLSGLLLIVPTIVTLVQLALARSREYDADGAAAALTGDPDGLADALVVMQAVEGRIWERIAVGGSGGPDLLLLQTHPPLADRVRRLRALQAESPAVTTSPDPVPADYPPATHRPRLRRTGIRW